MESRCQNSDLFHRMCLDFDFHTQLQRKHKTKFINLRIDTRQHTNVEIFFCVCDGDDGCTHARKIWASLLLVGGGVILWRTVVRVLHGLASEVPHNGSVSFPWSGSTKNDAGKLKKQQQQTRIKK